MECGFYLLSGSDTEFSGVNKKIENQIKTLSKKCKTIKVVIPKKKGNVLESVVWRLPLGSWGAEYGKSFDVIENCSKGMSVSFFYIRTQFFDRDYISFLRKIRQTYKNAKIILEVPTYPYDFEIIKSKTMWPWYLKDHFYRGKVKEYVDRITTFSDDCEIFGVPTIKIKNGISVDDVDVGFGVNKYKDKNDSINLLAVAQFQKSHGYERIIKGFCEYYKKSPQRQVILHMVGEGPEKAYYESLVKQYRLQDYIKFYGKTTGTALAEMYSIADIGLSCFGLYKRKIRISSALKVREYLAYGLPVVSGAYEDAFGDSKCEFYLSFPNDDSTVSIDRIVDFYDKLTKDTTMLELRKCIRQYAKRNVDIAVTMKPVIDYLATC